MTPASAPSRRLPASIWALGLVSLLMDVSSELIHSLLPVFMVTVLGASMLTVGLIEGAAESTALIVKVFAGALSDWWGRRKPLAIMGYGLGALSKPLFALAPGIGLVLGVDRFLDMCRTVLNVIGDLVAATVVSAGVTDEPATEAASG